MQRRALAAEARAERAERDAAARVEAAGKRAKAEATAERERAEACLADALRRERIYEAALKRGAAPSSFWSSPIFYGVVGAVVGGGICAGSVAAAR